MQCNTLKLKGFEVFGSSFQDRKFIFTNRDISSDTFKAIVYSPFAKLFEVDGVVSGSEIFFSYSQLETLKQGYYRIEFWADFQNVGSELIAIDDFTISSDPQCVDIVNETNFQLEFKEEIINFTMQYALFGGGSSGGSVEWSDVTGKPSLFPPSAHTHTWSQILDKPAFFSGNYNDLSNKPVLFSGNYNDLTNKPSIPSAQVNSDWNATGTIAEILNKPILFSGSYNDLTNKPTLFNGTWSALSGKPATFPPSAHSHVWSDISNPPDIFSGDYNDLTNKPTLFNGTWASLTGKPSTFTPPVANETTLGGVKVWFGTQAQYDALGTKVSDTMYYIQS